MNTSHSLRFELQKMEKERNLERPAPFSTAFPLYWWQPYTILEWNKRNYADLKKEKRHSKKHLKVLGYF